MRRCPECDQENPAGARFPRFLRAGADRCAGAEREERLAAAAATKGLSAAAYTPGIEPYEEAHDG